MTIPLGYIQAAGVVPSLKVTRNYICCIFTNSIFFLHIGLESSSNGIHPMTDTQDYLVYENQRWNPLTGYTSTGLPTDRYMWSDVTGKHKRTREHAKLLSMHWHWVNIKIDISVAILHSITTLD